MIGYWTKHALFEQATRKYCMQATRHHLRIGEEMTGPLPLTTSKSMPKAVNGVRMSLNMMTPSGRKASHGCMESSMAISAVSDRSLKGILSENLQKIPFTGEYHLKSLCLLHTQKSKEISTGLSPKWELRILAPGIRAVIREMSFGV
jgi:hypothetical protein